MNHMIPLRLVFNRSIRRQRCLCQYGVVPSSSTTLHSIIRLIKPIYNDKDDSYLTTIQLDIVNTRREFHSSSWNMRMDVGPTTTTTTTTTSTSSDHSNQKYIRLSKLISQFSPKPIRYILKIYIHSFHRNENLISFICLSLFLYDS
jgi:hypothetical protein